ncbi:MAG: proline iminopeptidase-family hydrolase [Halobacteriales archaeon]|nr:proline iminopeptidase-family hydrolase [Halobacteriales archaeon]
MAKRPQFDVPHYEGYLSIDVGDLYYREFGTGDHVLVGLHGGPGAAHDYLAPLTDVAGEDWTLYLYDQYGCGRSDRPPDSVYDEYTMAAYRDRLDEVRRAIGEDAVHLYGQSWGGWLALDYVLEYPDRVVSLTLANTSADIERAGEAMWAAALDAIDEEDHDEFRKLVEAHDFDDDAMEAFNETFVDEHVNRSDAEPFEFAPASNSTIYGVMWGPSEFRLAETARLREWDVTDRLGEIECPTLVIAGEHDEISPELAREMAEEIPDARLELFEGASHLPLWEEREAHAEVLEDFLASVA